MNVLDLPTEILGQIFNHYVHDSSKVRQTDPERASLRRISAYIGAQTDPVDLTHVCQVWRTTAISNPQLWATIYADEPRSGGDCKLFELWLQRSAGPDADADSESSTSSDSGSNSSSGGDEGEDGDADDLASSASAGSLPTTLASLAVVMLCAFML